MTRAPQKQKQGALFLAILAAAQVNYSCAQSSKKVKEPSSQAASANKTGDYKEIAQDVKGAFKAYLTEASATEENKGLIATAKEIDAQSADKLADTFSSEDFENVQDAVLLEQMIAEEATGENNIEKYAAIGAVTGGVVILAATTGFGIKWYREKAPVFDQDATIDELYTKLVANKKKIKALQNLSPTLNPLKDGDGGKKVFMTLSEFETKIKASAINDAQKTMMIASYGDMIRNSIIIPGGEFSADDKLKIKDIIAKNNPEEFKASLKRMYTKEVDGRVIYNKKEELTGRTKRSIRVALRAADGNLTVNDANDLIASNQPLNQNIYDGLDRSDRSRFTVENADGTHRLKTDDELFNDIQTEARKFGINIIPDADATNDFNQLKPALRVSYVQSGLDQKIAANRLAASKTTKNRRIGGAFGVILGAGFVIAGSAALITSKDKNKKDSSTAGSTASTSEDTQSLQLTSNASPEEKLMKALQQAEGKIAVARFNQGI